MIRARHPGELSSQDKIKRMVRVNHAGEYGAKRIYEGQIAILGATDKGDMLRHMYAQECQHLEGFETLIHTYNVRPTFLSPLWHVAGYALGAGTALMGSNAAMACTVAVEEVIDEHYAAQEQILKDDPEAQGLYEMVKKYRAEELEHKDLGLEHGAQETPGYTILTTFIKAGSRLAIWLSTRI